MLKIITRKITKKKAIPVKLLKKSKIE